MDDDKIYDKNTVMVLVEGWKRHPNSVVSRKGGIIYYGEINEKMKKILSTIKKQKKSTDLLKYKKKIVSGAEIQNDTCIDIIFGTGGVLYKASYFQHDIFNIINNDKPFLKNVLVYR